MIPSAKVGIVGMYRNEETFEPVQYYVKLPKDMKHRSALILDPMLATGGTLVATVDLLKKAGCRILPACFLSRPLKAWNVSPRPTPT